MKAIRIIAIVLGLIAAACGSSTDESTQISSSAAESSAAYDEAASADPAGEDAEAMASEPASDPAENGDSDEATESGDADDNDNEAERTSNDPGSDGDTDSVATGFLARVSDATVEASTGRFEGRLVVEAAPGAVQGGSFELTLDGAYDLDAEAFDVSVDLSGLAGLAAAEASPGEAEMFASMFAEPVQVRSIGGIAWVRWSLLAGMFGAMTDDGGTAWIEAAADEAASMTGQFGVDGPQSPTDLLQTLADLDATVVEVGRETIRGVETTHYAISIDIETAAAGLSPEERAQLEAELPGGFEGELPIDLWIGDDGLLRRLVVELDDLGALGLDADAEGVASVLIEFEIFDVGQPIAIQPPPADQVISTDDLGFNLDGGF